MASRIGLENLARLGTNVQIPGVRWDEYTFPLDGDEDARLEAEAIFNRARKAEWVVITDSAGRSWVFKRGETKPAVAPAPVVVPSLPAPLRESVTPVLALPPPTPVDTTAKVVTAPAVTVGSVPGLKFACRLQVKKLRRLLSLLGPIAKEVRLRVDRDGWSVLAVDPSQVAMVSLRLDRSQFDEWLWSGPVEMNVDREKWVEIAKLPKPNEAVDFIYGTDGMKPGIGFKFGHIERVVRLPTELPDEPKLPTVSPAGAYDVPVGAFVDAIRQAESFTDHLVLTGTERGLRAKGYGDVDQGESVLAEMGRGSAKSTYPLDFLSKFARAVKGAEDSLSVGFGDDYPLKLGFATDGTVGYYLLAPRIEED